MTDFDPDQDNTIGPILPVKVNCRTKPLICLQRNIDLPSGILQTCAPGSTGSLRGLLPLIRIICIGNGLAPLWELAIKGTDYQFLE